MQIQELSNKDDLSEIISGKKAVLLYFYNNHCAPCISLRPKLESLIKTFFPKFEYIYINGDQHQIIQASYGIFENPAILMFFEGNEYFREGKFISIPVLKRKIERIYEMLFLSK